MNKARHKLLRGIKRNPLKNISKIDEGLKLLEEIGNSVNEWGFAPTQLIRKAERWAKNGY